MGGRSLGVRVFDRRSAKRSGASCGASGWTCLRLAAAAALAAACGSQAAGKLAAETASAIIDGAAKGSSSRPPDFLGEGPYCDLWKSSDRTCPALPECSRLSSRRLPTNACVRSDRLMPVTSCLGDRWNGNQPRVCQSGVFPQCSGLVEESCWEYDELVCLEPGGAKRLLECCVGARSDCVANTYSLVEQRSTSSPPEKPREAAAATGSEPDGEAEDAGADAADSG